MNGGAAGARRNSTCRSRGERAFEGRGIEFAKTRSSQEGDDIWTIDWNVSAWMDATYVKVCL